ncbi:unnamed protein product [Tenebrio molitor]|nr:unnamed protein product [Tenebrio molitor]
MAHIRKLATFRQLSLNCETPTLDQRRKSLRKQFSEEFCEGAKTRDRPHPIRIAWADNSLASPKQEGVVAKKCLKEAKKPPKLSRHSSLEKESILYSKQELADRLRQALKDREQTKPNLNIFLAHNTNTEDEPYEEPEVAPKETPKIIPPLLTPRETIKNVFQIRKNKDVSFAPTKSSAIVVVPLVDKEPPQILDDAATPPSSDRSVDKQDPKAIKDVIIRPATAAAKRERFQKRSNTAFNAVIKESPARPPLVRSSSAPTKPDQGKPKFLATKRKIKSGKLRVNKCPTSEDEDSVSNKENPKSKKEMNSGSEIVTMVSLISPAASDTEEVEVEVKPKPKSSPIKPSLGKKEEKDVVGGKNVSLRKTVKSVSFQSSSIHAIRSFSASFPARRGSMATALMLGNGAKNQKNQEKRATNSAVPDDDERGPKRRLVRSATDKTQKR